MEKKIINHTTLLISSGTSGIFSGLIGGICCCLPFFSGIVSVLIYEFIESKPISFSGAILASSFSGFIAAIPASLLNLLALAYVIKNQEKLSPDLQVLFSHVTTDQIHFLDTLLPMTFLFVTISVFGGLLHQLIRNST